MRILFIFLFFSLLTNVWLFSHRQDPSVPKILDVEEQKYPLLSKRIHLEDYDNDILIRFNDLRSEVRSIVRPYANSFGLYFEYLPTGVSIGVNEKNEFTAASLLKVPVVMAYLMQQYEKKTKQDETVTLTEEMLNKEFGSLWEKGAGAKVPMTDAMILALEESDNTAIAAVISRTKYDYFKRVNSGLDIDVLEIDKAPVISLKSYSSILKALYFASVINKEQSQFILSHLMMSKFKDKLPAGTDKGTPVANKVGIIPDKLYSDCGIVYVPKRPYLLCMASFSDESEARERMVFVSRKIYKYVSDPNLK